MKFHFTVNPSTFFATTLVLSSIGLFKTAEAALDCSQSSSVNRIETGQFNVCDHFEGVDHDEYLAWYDATNIEGTYTNSIYLRGSDPQNPQNGAAVHWKVDETHVYIAVAARATGWLGFGISEAGGMRGTDMALFTAAQPDVLVDAFTTDDLYPQVDDCASDWELISSNADGEFLMIEFKRLLDTNDPQDKTIIDDSSDFISPHRIIAAWGNTESWSYHGLNRARGSIRFHGQGDEKATFDAAMQRSAEGSFIVQSREYQVPSDVVTHYGYTCFSKQDMLDQGVPDVQELNIVGWEPIVEEENIAHVHHFIVYGSTQSLCPNATDLDFNNEDFTEMAYVWAPGEGGLALPDFLGAPFFGMNNFNAFMIEVHYDNPTLTSGIVDSSGVRMYWTSQIREQQVGIMSTGDPNIGLFGQPVGEGLSKHVFECPSSCSEFVNQEVTVMREYLHLHQTGKRIVNEQIRNGEVIRKGSVEHWDFDQNGNAAIQQGQYNIKPGDGFKTTCYYEDNGQATFGLASAEEMCMAFLYYFPRTQIQAGDFSFPWTCGYQLGFPACEASYVGSTLSSDDELEREFGAVRDQCPGTAATVDESEPGSSSNQDTASNETSGTPKLSATVGAMCGLTISVLALFV